MKGGKGKGATPSKVEGSGGVPQSLSRPTVSAMRVHTSPTRAAASADAASPVPHKMVSREPDEREKRVACNCSLEPRGTPSP